ncbi:MAG: DNA helicase RecQ [Parcubacteria group bacterium]|nr:DNA helicase RecQ [Parcubacteria group bacterium]
MKKLLKSRFGYDEFRPFQEDAINGVLQGRDTFVLMPTGGGKSLCFQFPALKMKGVALVISPLIALMKDQVDALKANGITAEFINSSLTPKENYQIQKLALDDKIKILYIAPERLSAPSFQSFLQMINIGLIAIDEAHCISEWGHDFRPDYRNLKFLKKQFPKTPIVALTATATAKVREDIVKQLSLENPNLCISNFDRPNLTLNVFRKKRTYEKLLHLIEKYKGESVIIYCFSRKETERIARDLKSDGFRALPYHAGLDNKIRKKNQDLFIKDEADIMVATIAFGMGIDKPDIRLVVHYTFPKTLEGYYQEIGRAGRDGLPSECALFYSYGDKMKHEYFLDMMEDDGEREKSSKKLQQVIDYCEQTFCRRKYLLKYFGEDYGLENCSGCDMCLGDNATFDATEITQKILSCVVRTGSRFGKNYVIDVLKGKETEQILRNQHNQLSVFDIVKDFTKDELKNVVNALCSLSLLQVSEGKYPTISLASKGVDFLDQKQTLELRKIEESIEDRVEDKKGSKASKQALEYDTELFEKLRILRKEIAEEMGVPPFVVFGDVSLRAMSHYFPDSADKFLMIDGVGVKKLESFGTIFIEKIQEHTSQNNLISKEISYDNKSQHRKLQRQANNPNCDKTKRMLLQKLSISEIADKQGLTQSTVVGHIEKLILAGENVDINHLKPSQEDIEQIQLAFEKSGSTLLRPVYESLEGKYSYEDIKLTRLFFNM